MVSYDSNDFMTLCKFRPRDPRSEFRPTRQLAVAAGKGYRCARPSLRGTRVNPRSSLKLEASDVVGLRRLPLQFAMLVLGSLEF